MRSGRLVALAVVASVAALAVGYFGVSWLLSRGETAVLSPGASPGRVGLSDRGGNTAPPRTPPAGGNLGGSSGDAIVVHGTGDVNLDIGQLGLLRSGFDAPWSGMKDLFTTDDITVVNLECAAGEGGAAQDKQYTFRCHHPAYGAMRSAGVEVANQANNHAMDFGVDPLLDGQARLRAADVVPVGSGRNAAEANAPFIFEVKGRTVAILGFSAVVPFNSWLARADTPGLANGYDIANLTGAVRAAKAQADHVIATIHMGVERATTPRAADVARARALIDAGADAVFGHHAHVLQPLEFYKDRPIFFGLGNFVWPSGGPTAVGEVVIEPDGSVRACMLPARIAGGRPTLNDPAARCP